MTTDDPKIEFARKIAREAIGGGFGTFHIEAATRSSFVEMRRRCANVASDPARRAIERHPERANEASNLSHDFCKQPFALAAEEYAAAFLARSPGVIGKSAAQSIKALAANMLEEMP
jgi:hypothetical protein